MEFWLKQDKGSAIKLPVTPESFEVQVAHKNQVVNVVTLGEINLLGKSGLRTVTLSCFFPYNEYYFSDPDADYPSYYVEQIEDWRTDNTIIRLIIGHTVNFKCSIESFNYGMRDGTKDIYYTITLKEYRTVSLKKRTTKKIKATKHKIKQGDTLNKISKKYYGDDKKAYREKIYKANKKVLTSKTKLPKGEKIKIPAITKVTWK